MHEIMCTVKHNPKLYRSTILTFQCQYYAVIKSQTGSRIHSTMHFLYVWLLCKE
jgi:hypothetical protein